MLNEDIIQLSDDDENDKIPPKKRKAPRECINIECSSESKYLDSVPSFVLTYYRMKRSARQKVCRDCFEEAVDHNAELLKRFDQEKSIYDVSFPKYKPVLELDSDEEDVESIVRPEELLDEETITMIEDNLSEMLTKALSYNKTRLQIDDSCTKVIAESKKLLEEYDEFEVKARKMQTQIDSIRREIYAPYRPIRTELPAIEIIDVRSKVPTSDRQNTFNKIDRSGPLRRNLISADNKMDSTQDVIAVSEEILVPPKTLPPQGEKITRQKLKEGDVVFAMNKTFKQPWKLASIIRIFIDNGVNKYQVKLSPNHKRPPTYLYGKHLAYALPSAFRFLIGFRVIGLYKLNRSQSDQNASYYSGTIAEPPKVMNKFRYLIFFDDGCAQYVPHENIRLIVEPSSTPWDDIPSTYKDFIRKYLCDYPERPMVKLHPGNIIKVEYHGEWLSAKVMDVDGSLVNMLFLLDGRMEWIYRGSLRLEPLFKAYTHAKRRSETGSRIRRIAIKQTQDSPYVEYTHGNAGEEEYDDSPEQTSRSRTVARKSTTKRSRPLNYKVTSVPGNVEPKTLKNVPEPKKFVPHQCGPDCISWTEYDKSKTKYLGPLEIPLNFGFRRIISHFGGDKRCVLYRAPCGRCIRNMEEIHLYLRITRSTMTVDFFDYDYWVNCLAEFVIERANVNLPDVTEGKEFHPISCVNYIDTSLPDFTSYFTERTPRENVGLNLDEEFLCSCDCTDDCQNKKQCACWLMTFESQKIITNHTPDPNIGYNYRRLSEYVITGIFECNSQCKCSKTCLNRVVQNQMCQKLQLFKTEMKGWGLRCLTDIPQGAFICVYAGHLLTDQEANEEGRAYGDEYLAELDYIEIVEQAKDGYESDVPDLDLDETVDERNDDDSFETIEITERRLSSEGTPSPEAPIDEILADENNIRSRLRERKVKIQVSAAEKERKRRERFSLRQYYGDDGVFIMDAKSSGNIGRFLNHSCMPNVFVQNVFVDTQDPRFPWIAFFAQTYIRAGTELTWDYRYDIGSVKGTVKYCYCGTEQCRGRLL